MKMNRRFEAAYDDGHTVWVEEWSAVAELDSGAGEGSSEPFTELRLADGGGAVNRSPDGGLVDVSTGRRLIERS